MIKSREGRGEKQKSDKCDQGGKIQRGRQDGCAKKKSNKRKRTTGGNEGAGMLSRMDEKEKLIVVPKGGEKGKKSQEAV